MHIYAALLAASAAALAPSTSRPPRRSRIYTAVAEPETTDTKVEPPKCPLNAEAQLLAARDAILRASEAGITRQQLRTLLRRDGDLVPPDETWTGGIMQLYGACLPARKSQFNLYFNSGSLAVGARCCSLDTVARISRRSCPSLETHWLISTQVPTARARLIEEDRRGAR